MYHGCARAGPQAGILVVGSWQGRAGHGYVHKAQMAVGSGYAIVR